MQDFLDLWSGWLLSISEFLMTEPIIYFVGCILLLFVAGIVKNMMTIKF